MKNIIYTLIFTILSVLNFSCKKTLNYSKDNLSFSADTVLFDTVFTTIGSTTKRFKIYNNDKSKLKIDDIQLMGGTDSPFRINIDGESGIYFSDIEMNKKDSLFAFVEVTLEVNNVSNPLVISDSIRFRTNGKDQYVNLDVWGQDAYFHANEVVSDAEPWLNDKPHVIYGVAAVGYPGIDSNLTLTIPAGTQVYGHKNSALFVYKSTLLVQGQLGNEVVFQGDRLESFYNDVSGQWRGVWLSQAKNCNIDYAIIKNGSVGLQVDTTSGFNTLNLTNTIITNNDFYNLWLVAGAIVNAENCVFGDAGVISTYCFAGGDASFTNCNFTNYWSGSRSGPGFALKNWFEGSNGLFYEQNVTLDLFNCIMYGNAQDEFIIDSLANGAAVFDVNIVNCLMKKEEIYNYAYLSNILWNQDPMFIDLQLRDFHPSSGSPLIDAGDNTTFTANSIDGVSRGSNPDIGAYEFN